MKASTTPEQPQAKLNLFGISNLRYKAGSMVSFNTAIDVPSATAAGPGSQTVTGTCTAPAGASFFAIGTHTYAHATAANVNFFSGGTTTNIVHTTDWLNPDVGVWLTPPFLAVGAGDQFTYSCAYANDGSQPVMVGETEAHNECAWRSATTFPRGTSPATSTTLPDSFTWRQPKGATRTAGRLRCESWQKGTGVESRDHRFDLNLLARREPSRPLSTTA